METFTGEQPEAGDPSSDPVSHDPWMSVAMASHDLGMPEATPSHDPPIDQVDNNHSQSVIVPEVGMAFNSEDDAYEMYNSYARSIGFSIRKSTTRLRSDKTLYQKHIVCSNQGERVQYKSRGNLEGAKGFSCKLLESEGAMRTYKVTPARFQDEAIIVFNSEDMTITCSCRKYESIGILCKHALRVYNINEVFILPTQYILNRWTKYAKRGFYCEKKQTHDSETSTTQAARISRKATSIALKCTVSKELLDDLERAIDKLNLEADNSLSQLPPNSCGVSKSCIEYAGEMLQGKVSVRAPQVIKGPNEKRSKNVLEKKKGKKKTTSKKKGKGPKNAKDNIEIGQDPQEVMDSSDASIGVNIAVQNLSTNTYGDFSTMVGPSIQGGYTGLILGLHQDASAAQKLHFDEVSDPSTLE